MKELNNGVQINSLETYFSHIKDLIDIDRKYSMLPLQEDYFIIDANARTITVPETFRKNGLGVQGDKTAETIYFKINRYFDAMDLDKTNIYIRWENADGEHGFSTEWVRDIDTFDDYMVFGWVLGNTITETPGPLKFSVSFIKTNGDQVVTYALNTLTAQAIINASLDFPIGTPDDSLNNLLAGNIVNTTTQTDSEINVFTFAYNFDNLILPDKSNLNNNVISANLVEKNGQYIVELLLYAYVDKGELSYSICKQISDRPDVNNDIIIASNLQEGENYREVEYDIALENHKYYEKKADGTYEYIYIVPGTTGIKNKYYENYVVYNLTKQDNTPITGTYYGTAISTINQSASSPIYTTYQVNIPGPSVVNFNPNIAYNGHAINHEIVSDFIKNEQDSATYKWYKANEDIAENYVVLENETNSTLIPTEKGFYKLEVYTTRNLDTISTMMNKGYCVTEQPTSEDIKIASPTAGGTIAIGSTPKIVATFEPTNPIAPYSLEYQWQKVIQTEGNKDYIDIEGATNNAYKLEVAGTYVCKLTATYNGLSTYKHSVEFIAE